MRTTISLDDAVLREAKKAAAASGRSLGEVVEDALRLSLVRPKASRAARRLDLPTCGGHGPRPGVDLDDTAGLVELMERPDGAS
jgi:hypothetical protein